MRRSGDHPASGAGGQSQVLEAVEKRMASLENLIRRSLHNQLERSVVEDETLADLDERMASLEKRLEALRKGPGKRS